jgi:hypothetical protein
MSLLVVTETRPPSRHAAKTAANPLGCLFGNGPSAPVVASSNIARKRLHVRFEHGSRYVPASAHRLAEQLSGEDLRPDDQVIPYLVDDHGMQLGRGALEHDA